MSTDDHSQEQSDSLPDSAPPSVSRKGFLTTAAAWLTSLSGLGYLSAKFAQYAFPVLEPLRTVIIPIAKEGEIAEGDSKTFSIGMLKAILIRQNGKYKAFSKVCPHLGCSVSWQKSEKSFHCPCHNARFDAEGNVVKGPPPRGLTRYEVSAKGDSIVLKYKTRDIYT